MATTFKDTVTNKVYSFEDDVSVILTAGVYSFKTKAGKLLLTPMTLQPYTPPVVVDNTSRLALVNQARVALYKSDSSLMRMVEAGVTVPASWNTYRKELRAIVNGGDSTSVVLPTIPAYPLGT